MTVRRDCGRILACAAAMLMLTAPPASAAVSTAQSAQKIAFTTSRDGNFEIYVANADGSGQTNLTRSPDVDREATWSPDGTKIAFTRSIHTGSSVYVMNADGSGQVQVITDASEPAWSPVGSKIAFTTGRDGNFEIYVANADGSGQTNLTRSPDVDREATWSPDGTKIAFTRSIHTGSSVYVMNADGSGQVQVITDASEPAWSTSTLNSPCEPPLGRVSGPLAARAAQLPAPAREAVLQAARRLCQRGL